MGRCSDSSSELGHNNNNNRNNSASPNNQQDKLVSLHESLAAELRQKLKPAQNSNSKASASSKQPLLLPPKDYDTVHRQRGDVGAADRRRALNPAIVGSINNNKASDNSSGIGSDNHRSPVNTPPNKASSGRNKTLYGRI